MENHRKLIKFGTSSYVVSIPNDWIKKNKLEKGDVVFLSQNPENELIISVGGISGDQQKTSIEIVVDGKDLSRVKREIIASYLNNHNIITLKGKNLEKYAQTIRQTVHNMMGMEIVEENYRAIIAKDFMNLHEVVIEEMIRKVDNIARSMIEDIPQILEKDISESIVQRDDQINRMVFLLTRVMKQTLNDPSHTNKKNVLSTSKIIDMWEVIFHIEKIADFLKRIARNMSRIRQRKEVLNDLFVVYARIKKLYWDTFKAYYTQDGQTSLGLSEYKRILADDCNKLHEKYWRVRYAPIIIEDYKNVISSI